MTAEEFFVGQFNKCKCTWIEDNNNPGNIYMVFDKHHERKKKLSSILNDGKVVEFVKSDDTVTLFYQDHKNGYLYCNYSKIWSVLEDKYGLKSKEIRGLIVGILNDDTKLKVLTPCNILYNNDFVLNGDTKLKVLTPSGSKLDECKVLNDDTKLKQLTPTVDVFTLLE